MKKPVILIADDEQVNTFLISQIFKEFQCQVITAADGRQAYELSENHKPDIILLDIMMPEMDGFEVLHKIKMHNQIKHTPVVMISAKTEYADIERAISLGASDYLTKPVNNNKLIRTVQSLISLT